MAKAGRKPFINRDYIQDEYFKRWMVGLSDKTKRSYNFAFKEWLDFIGMSPTEQILKRGRDVINPNPIKRRFFEDKWREYKELSEAKETSKDSSIHSKLKVVASFFSRNGLRLNLKRGDWTSTQTQEVITKKWIPTNEDIRRMYGHANLRDRALLVVLYQSGFSQIDVANMKIEHLKGLMENPETEHYFIEKRREKRTHVQATCLSFECVHDIKLMLHERGNPEEGYLFVSQTKLKENLKIAFNRILKTNPFLIYTYG